MCARGDGRGGPDHLRRPVGGGPDRRCRRQGREGVRVPARGRQIHRGRVQDHGPRR